MAEFNGKELTPELVQKALSCKSADELRALAEENGISITAEEAEAFLEELSGRELNMEELDNIAGGDVSACLTAAEQGVCYAVGGCAWH